MTNLFIIPVCKSTNIYQHCNKNQICFINQQTYTPKNMSHIINDTPSSVRQLVKEGTNELSSDGFDYMVMFT